MEIAQSSYPICAQWPAESESSSSDESLFEDEGTFKFPEYDNVSIESDSDLDNPFRFSLTRLSQLPPLVGQRPLPSGPIKDPMDKARPEVNPLYGEEKTVVPTGKGRTQSIGILPTLQEERAKQKKNNKPKKSIAVAEAGAEPKPKKKKSSKDKKKKKRAAKK